MAEAQPPAVVPAEVDRGQFIETFTVREGTKRYQVAANATASRALMQVNVAKLRGLCERSMKFYEDNPTAVPSPKELKILAEAFSLVEGMAGDAYSDSKKGGPMANSLERLVFAATAGAAAGAHKAGSNTPEARLKRLTSIGKAKPVEKVAPAQQEPIDLDE